MSKMEKVAEGLWIAQNGLELEMECLEGRRFAMSRPGAPAEPEFTELLHIATRMRLGVYGDKEWGAQDAKRLRELATNRFIEKCITSAPKMSELDAYYPGRVRFMGWWSGLLASIDPECNVVYYGFGRRARSSNEVFQEAADRLEACATFLWHHKTRDQLIALFRRHAAEAEGREIAEATGKSQARGSKGRL